MAVAATVHAPGTFADAAALLAAATAAGETVRIVGGATKLAWGAGSGPPSDVELHTTGLDAIVAHDPGDMTATLEAGVALADAQRSFARAGQMLALDPPLGPERSATIGGLVATGDCGPLSHRYGGPRDLVVGATVALADGTIARSGGTVIKNVAGYDIAKLLCGSFGTLGLVLAVNVRLHPLPERAATAVAAAADPDVLATAARALAALPAELVALDVSWRPDGGELLACCVGPEAAPRARRVAAAMAEHGLDGARTVEHEAHALWERQRAGQRSGDQAVIRVAAPPGRLAAVLSAAQTAGARSLVGRVALGHSYVTLDAESIPALRGALPDGAASMLLDAPAHARAAVAEPWGTVPAPTLALMRAVKARFDPTGTCNPSGFVV